MANTIARDLTGDVIPVDRSCYFNIECKSREDFSLDAVLSNPRGCQFTQWWHQTNYDAKLCSEQHNRPVMPLLFFKPIPNWDWIAIDTEAIGILSPKPLATSDWIRSSLWFPHFLFDFYVQLGEISHNVAHTKKDKNKVMVPLKLRPCFICRWRDFAAHVEPESFFYGAAKWDAVDAADAARPSDRPETPS